MCGKNASLVIAAALTFALLTAGHLADLKAGPASTSVPASASSPAGKSTTKPKGFTISKETTVVDGPLLADGTIDYVKLINDHYGRGVTKESNAFFAIAEAFGVEDSGHGQSGVLGWYDAPRRAFFTPVEEYTGGQDDTTVELRESITVQNSQALNGTWRPKQGPELAGWVRCNKEALDLIVKAGKCKHLYLPVVSSEVGLIDRGLIFNSQMLPQAAYALAARSIMQASEGDLSGALADLEGLRGVCSLVANRFCMDYTYGNSCAMVADWATYNLATEGNLNAGQLRQILKTMESAPPISVMEDCFTVGERYLRLEEAMHGTSKGVKFFLEVRDGTMDLPYRAWLGYMRMPDDWDSQEDVKVDWDEYMRRLNATFDDCVAYCRMADGKQRLQILSQRRDAMKPSRYEQTNRKAFQDALGAIDAGDPKAVAKVLHQTVIDRLIHWESLTLREFVCQRRELHKLGVILELYHAEKGHYPTKLEELVPNYIKSVPVDFFSQKAVKYNVKDDDYILYSIGADLEDNGGIELKDIVIRRPKRQATSAPASRPTTTAASERSSTT